MSTYLYSGKDLYRMEKSLKSLLDKNRIDKEHTTTVDGSDKKNFRIESLLMACDSYSLFDEDSYKAVILKNPYFLNASVKEGTTSKKKNDVQEKRMELLEAYLKQQNPNTILVIYCHGFDADSRKKEFKLLNKYGIKPVSFPLMNDKDFDTYMQTELRKAGYSLRNDAIKELKERVSTDTLKLHQAIEKMNLYGKQQLNVNDIKHIVPVNGDVNIFKISNAFIKKDMKSIIESKDEMLIAGYDYVALISMLASRIRMLYNMKLLYERGYGEENIAIRLHANKWAVKFGLQDCSTLRARQLLRYLVELAELDQNIKNGLVLPKDGFDDFILRNVR